MENPHLSDPSAIFETVCEELFHFSRNECAMNRQENRQLLGTCSLKIDEEEKRVDVYEFHYLWQRRIGIELVDRQDVNAGIFAVLSTNAPEVTLEPGEFIVKTYSENKDLWQQMERFPEFEDTGRVAVLSDNKCPIWRLRCYDVCPAVLLTSIKVESDFHFTGVIEKIFCSLQENKAKRQYKDVIASSHLIDVLKLFSQALCESDFFSEEAQRYKRNEKRLTKDFRGRWKIVGEEEI